MKKTLIATATYNEYKNIDKLIYLIFKASAKASQAVKFIEELQENKKQIVKDPELKADKNKVAWIQKVPA